MNDTLLTPETVGDLLRVLAVVLAGISFGMSVTLMPLLKRRWNREDLLGARMFLAVHGLVVLFIAGALAEKVGEALSWRTPVALVIFSTKIAMLALLRERLAGLELREVPPSRRLDD